MKNLNSTIERLQIQISPASYSLKYIDKIDFLNLFSYPIVKIIIPRDCHNSAMFELNQMNINSSTLFPGLDGLARSLLLYFRLNTLDGEFERTIEKW